MITFVEAKEFMTLKERVDTLESKLVCPACKGRGYSVYSAGAHSDEESCETCNGTGLGPWIRAINQKGSK